MNLLCRKNQPVSVFTAWLLGVLFFGGCLAVSPEAQRFRQEQVDYFTNEDNRERFGEIAAETFPEIDAICTAADERGATIVPPHLISFFRPKYPHHLARKEVQSGVWIALVVDEKGRIAQAVHLPDSMRPADPELIASALKAVQKWRFSVGTIDGKPAPFVLSVPVLFQLKV